MLGGMSRFLQKRGRVAEGHANPLHALLRWQEEPSAFDIVVVDLDNLTMNALEFMASAYQINADLPVIVLTIDRNTPATTEALAAGAFHAITKPIAAMEEFVAVLDSAVRASRRPRTGGAPVAPSDDASVGARPDAGGAAADLTSIWAVGGDDNLAWTDQLSLPEAKKFASDTFERRYILRALERSRGNIAEAARHSGIDRSNFRRVLSRLGIAADKFRD